MSSETIVGVLVFAFLVYSIILHEIAHAYTALLFGDPTAKEAGRITLNPIPHIDLWMTIIIPALCYFLTSGSFIIGGAKPVPINPSRLRPWVLGDLAVSVAGVFVNFMIGVLLIGVIKIMLAVNPGAENLIAYHVFWKAALLNIFLMLFNLIPVPPLDGSHLVRHLLPFELRRSWDMLGYSGIGFIIIIVLINVPAFYTFMIKILVWVSFDFLGMPMPT